MAPLAAIPAILAVTALLQTFQCLPAASNTPLSFHNLYQRNGFVNNAPNELEVPFAPMSQDLPRTESYETTEEYFEYPQSEELLPPNVGMDVGPHASHITTVQPQKAYHHVPSIQRAIHPIMKCPPGYLLSGNECASTRTVPAEMTCPKSASYFEGGKCITLDITSPVLSCHKGYLDGKKCAVVEIATPSQACEKDYEFIMGECVKEVMHHAKQVCPAGYDSKHGHSCTKQTVVLAQPVCPFGYQIDSNFKTSECIMTNVAPPTVACPKGYEANGDRCVSVKFSDPHIHCPKGARYDGRGFCRSITEVEPTHVCPTGFLDEKTKECLEDEFAPLMPNCKKGYEYVNGVCVSRKSHQIDLKCRHGFELFDNKCIAVEKFEPNYICPIGTVSHDKKCSRSTEVPVEFECKKGELASDQNCVTSNVHNPILECAKGSKLDGDHCVSHVKGEPTGRCEYGAILEGKHCVTTHNSPAEYFCKHGSSPGPLGCPEEHYKHGSFHCPEGFKREGDSCVDLHETDYQLTCPPDSVLDGHKCISMEKTPADISCPKDFSMNSYGQCYSTEYAEPVLQCHAGHEVLGGMCVLQHKKKTDHYFR